MTVKSLSVDKPTSKLSLKKEKSKAKSISVKKKIVACISRGLKTEELLNKKSDEIKNAKKRGADKLDDVEEALRSALREKFFPDVEPSKESNADGDKSIQSDVDDDDLDNESSMSESQVDIVKTSGNSELTRSQRKRQRKRETVKLKRAAKAAIPKPEPQEPPTSSSIVLPTAKRFVCELDTDEKRLRAACARLGEMNNFVLQIRPVPRPCPPGLLKDLCPLATGIRFPAKPSSRYAFVQFRNNEELVATQNFIANKLFNGKPVRAIRAQPEVIPDKSQADQWRHPGERNLSDFKWNVLYVTHLPRATTRFDLAQVFRKAISIHMPTYDDGSCKGFCTLTYRTKLAALQAFETRHGTFVHGSSIHVNFALKNKRKPSKQVSGKRPLDNTADTHAASKMTRTEESQTKTTESRPSSDTFDPSFVIQSSAEPIPTKVSKKQSKVATKLPDKPHPKLTGKHQLKYKGMAKQSSTSSALDALLKPSSSLSKPKKKDRSKSKGNRSKSNKHR